MRSSKSRSRNKNRSRPQGGGNIVNRVFDSSGPEGKVRGTPAQIIEKYGQLARDAQLSGDRVALENFQQHSEHYTRMLAAAQKEIEARQGPGGQNQHFANQGGQNQPQNGGAGGYQGGASNGNPNGSGQNNQQPQGGNESRHQQEPRQPYEPRPQPEARPQPEPRQQDEARGPGEAPRAPRANRRRERNVEGDRRPQEQASAPADDVVDSPARDSGPVDTPEDASSAPKADKPRRTRTRKKAPSNPEGGDTGRAEDPAA